MLLTERLKRHFPPRVRSRGDAYFRSDRVSWFDWVGDGVSATVRGSGGEYTVELDWDAGVPPGAVAAFCDCPYFEDHELCKHVWALLLETESTLDPADLPRNVTRLVAATTDLLEFEDPPPAPRARNGRRTTGKRSGPRSKASAKPDWRDQLHPVRDQRGKRSLLDEVAQAVREELLFIIDVGASQSRDGLWIALYHRERGSTGKFGKWKRNTVHPAGITRRDEDPLLRELVTASDPEAADAYSYSYSYITPRFQAVLLMKESTIPLIRRLVEERHVRWQLSAEEVEEDSSPVVWDDGPAWALRVKVEPDAKRRQWLLTGRFVREGDATELAVHEVPVVVPGLVLLHDDRLMRLGSGEVAGWVQALRRTPEIRVPFKDRADLLKWIWSSGPAPAIDLPADLHPETVQAAPQPLLRVRPSPPHYRARCLLGDVLFDYDGVQVGVADARSAVWDPEAGRLLYRDTDAERSRLVELFALPEVASHYPGMALFNGLHSGPEAQVELPERALPEVVERLSGSGWTVEAEGRKVRQAGRVSLSVVSGIDWFDLSGEFAFGEVTASLPELLKAIQQGERFVRLGDGSQGLLPEAWLKRFGELADLGEKEGQSVRFGRAQAMLLDSLLAAKEQQQVRLDDPFKKLRRRLEKIDGVKPRSEPRAFRGTLREYQKRGLGWLHFLREFGFGGCLADDMGLGKTVQVLGLLESQRTRRRKADESVKPSIAVVPRSLVFNWVDEAERFTPHLRVAAYHGLQRKEVLGRLNELDLIVTTYGTMRRDITRLKDIPFDYAILDEAQAIKNANSQAAKAARLLTARHRLAMTGTPIENHLGELWSLFEFLNPGMLGRSQNFQQLARRIDRDRAPEALERLARGIQPFVLRRTKQQVLSDLPDKTEQTVHCELSKKERQQYDSLKNHYRALLLGKVEQQGLAKSKMHVLEALLRLRQAACHPGLLNPTDRPRPSAKLETLIEQLTEIIAEGHKVLVFSQFTSFLGIVKSRLEGQGVTYEYLDGRTTKRKQRVERFQSDENCPVFLISLKAGGHGLNLTAADYVFILDPWWNPAAEAQAIDRTHRIGQTRHVFAYRIIASDTVEEKILELQASKRALAESIINADESLLRRLTVEDLKLLLS